jgi:arginase
MVVAHIIGKGAPELVRFWGEPPLVREPDVTLFGLARLDSPEQEFLAKSPLRHIHAEEIRSAGAAAAAADALDHLHANTREFILHLDLDVIAQEEFPAVSVPGSGGLSFEDVRAALKEFVRHKNLLGLDVAQYNVDKDADGSGAKKVVDLLAEALSARLESLSAPAPESPAEAPKESSANTAA